MFINRRSALKLGLTALAVAPGTVVHAKKQQPLESWRDEFEAALPERMAAYGIPGLALAIVSKKSGTVYANAFGYADIGQQRKFTADTPTHVASISKLFTASALVQLFERKGLRLDQDVNDFLDFAVRNPKFPDVAITPFQLLTHTSSISDDGYDGYSVEGDPTQSLRDFLREYLLPGEKAYAPEKSFLASKPGSTWSYGNVAYALAGYIVEHVSGKEFSKYIEAEMFKPLAMQNARWFIRDFAPDQISKPYRFENGNFTELPQEGYPDGPAGMLRCSISDLATMTHALLNNSGQNPILSAKAVNAMLKNQLDAQLKSYQGLGWCIEDINGKQLIGHYGGDSGASNGMFLSPDGKYAAIALMNINRNAANDAFKAAMITELLAAAESQA